MNNELKKENLIKLSLEGVRMEYPSQKPIILLKEETGDRFLPIWVGAFEASAVALEMIHYKAPRPMTHDLIIRILEKLDAHVENIIISEIKDDTFYAIIQLVLGRGEKEIEIDSRPSDAIAIAVRCNASIYTTNKVITEAGLLITSIEEEVEKFKDFLDHTNPEDFNI